MIDDVISLAETFSGDVAVWHMDLTTGETQSYDPEKPLVAASVIKLFIMAEAVRRFEDGTLGVVESGEVSVRGLCGYVDP